MTSSPRIVDVRGLVARQVGRQFGRRNIADIRGVVFHQVLGDSDVFAVARYHVSTECHISPGRGCPSICYTYFVAKDGTINWCNDLEFATWSQGTGVPPIEGTRSNTNYLAIVFQGDFTGQGHTGKSVPTPEQLESGAMLWRWLRDVVLDIPADALYGHRDFGKPACPGDVLVGLIEKLRGEVAVLTAATPTTVDEWQRAFVLLGYDLGSTGSAKDGVDGEWGPVSGSALLAFQTQQGIPRSGARDRATASKVAEALVGRGLSLVSKKRKRR